MSCPQPWPTGLDHLCYNQLDHFIYLLCATPFSFLSFTKNRITNWHINNADTYKLQQ